MIRLGAITVLAVYLAIPAQSVAERTLSLLLNAPSSANNVWPGFSLSEHDWLLHDNAGAYLVTRKTPPPGFQRQGSWYFRAGTLPGLTDTLNLALPLEALTVVALPVSGTPERMVGFTYHEVFHAFQRAQGRQDEPRLLNQTGVISAEAAANVEVERRALREMLDAARPNTQQLQSIVAVRDRRRSLVDEAFIAIERRSETWEGLASYVQHRSAALVLGQSPRAATDAVRERLSLPMRVLGGSPDERLIRGRSYGTGAAIAMLLDQLSADWKGKAFHEPLDLLLSAQVARAGSSSVAADEAYRRHGYARLLTAAAPPWGPLLGLTDDEFHALAPFRLILAVPGHLQAAWSLSTAASRTSGMHRPAAGVLLLPNVSRYTATASGVSVAITGHSVRVQEPADGAAGGHTLTVLLPAGPRIVGAAELSGRTTSVTGLRVEADGVLITITGNVTLTPSDGALLITVSGPR